MTESQQQSQHQKELHARLWEMANDLRVIWKPMNLKTTY